ncbi:aspartate aminotransferase family protein [Actinophytocola oryzae]|uniref:Adenosylmethionine-8-amino-7-oxononanoate aminotransferase n=1 Tax=Actinophytocola oryzae TaxID=502181 RepID=A0A4R7W4I4_9PSEU|nr:aminotransferase class III-fold pyridoxal phosphate-dependent enzyme [Actinophytocola oryzae]TDV57432.1 adenosylmethionine-8-amino-7-oxononanoate aminotransferase [Actinophytocola oryzae]
MTAVEITAANELSAIDAATAYWANKDVAERTEFDHAAYPLWHGQSKMRQRLDRSDPTHLLVRGDGCWVEDIAGRRYLDARSGACNMALGYSRVDIVDAMAKQAAELPFSCVIRYDQPALTTVRYAAELVAAAPPGLTRVRFTHMGSASVENALHMSRLYHLNAGQPERTWIISLRYSFHGSTYLTLAASGDDFVEKVVPVPPPHLARTPVPAFADCPGCTGDPTKTGDCTAALRATVDGIGAGQVAAFIVEPMMEGPVQPMTRHFLESVRDLARKLGFLVIYDEVTTGFGRLGALFGATHFGVSPDILCSAKGITAGYAPLGAVLVAEHVYQAFDQETGIHFPNGSSSDGHPVSCAAASVALRAMYAENVFENARERGAQAVAGLREGLADNPAVGPIRGVGLLFGFELLQLDGAPSVYETTRRIQAACMELGVLVQHGGEYIVIYPPLVIDERETEILVDRVVRGIGSVTR